jgi:hypothetical protein
MEVGQSIDVIDGTTGSLGNPMLLYSNWRIFLPDLTLFQVDDRTLRHAWSVVTPLDVFSLGLSVNCLAGVD